MRPLLGAEGRRAIAALMQRPRLLLVFDFDGTLAPIVPRPEDARVPLPVASRLQRVCALWPVAVVSGRSVRNVSARLGFKPRFVVGNHGLEDPDDARDLLRHRWVMALDPLRHELRQRAADLARSGVAVEDKRFSIALHYRLAVHGSSARKAIDDILARSAAGLAVGEGKSVVNVAAVGAPDRGDAVLALARRQGAQAGLYVGDDDNDEPVFTKVPAGWVTIRLGADHVRTAAAFRADGPPQMPALLQMLLDARRRPDESGGRAAAQS
jgi:trehalose 6-phosphate phosphatase